MIVYCSIVFLYFFTGLLLGLISFQKYRGQSPVLEEDDHLVVNHQPSLSTRIVHEKQHVICQQNKHGVVSLNIKIVFIFITLLLQSNKIESMCFRSSSSMKGASLMYCADIYIIMIIMLDFKIFQFYFCLQKIHLSYYNQGLIRCLVQSHCKNVYSNGLEIIRAGKYKHFITIVDYIFFGFGKMSFNLSGIYDGILCVLHCISIEQRYLQMNRLFKNFVLLRCQIMLLLHHLNNLKRLIDSRAKKDICRDND